VTAKKQGCHTSDKRSREETLVKKNKQTGVVKKKKKERGGTETGGVGRGL